MAVKIIKSISIKNWLGVSEKTFEPGKINIISGPKGAGKTSITEAIEYALTGKLDGKEKRGLLPKTELIKHGEKEATLFVEMSDGLVVDRKLRAESSDYLKVSKPGEAVPSTEGFLRSFIKGDIFRPGEFLKKKPEEQAAMILDMLEIPWTKDDIANWFGEIPEGINFDMHILKILKQIEDKYYKERAAINQQIDVLKAQAKGYKDQLPANYDGEVWREKKVAEYYAKVAEAEEVNKKIIAAKNAIEGLESKIAAIKSAAEIDKQVRKNAFDRQRAEGREYIQFLNQKIEGGQKSVDEAENRILESDKALDNELAAEIEKLKGKYEQLKATARDNIRRNADIEKTTISNYKSSISAKEQELLNIDELEKQALTAIDEKTEEQIKTVDAEAGNSKKILETTTAVDVEPLRKEAEEVAEMQSYLRDYDLMKDILINKLAPKEADSKALTAKIEKARSLPLELLKISKCPIDGITVDSNGMLRINGTLLNGLSDGEMKDLAVRVAKNRAEAGDLKIICFDGFQDLNPEEQKKIIEEAKRDGFQWYFLSTTDGKLGIEIIDMEDDK
jgi:DNA repair exonuclease SbcCD ATPase subunit